MCPFFIHTRAMQIMPIYQTNDSVINLAKIQNIDTLKCTDTIVNSHHNKVPIYKIIFLLEVA